MYIRYILYLVFSILDKGAALRNVEIKFYKVFKSFISSDIYIHTYIHKR